MCVDGKSHLLLVAMQPGEYLPLCKTRGKFLTRENIVLPSSNHTARYLPKGAEKFCPCKNLHMNVGRSFISSCQESEATKESFARGINRGTFLQWNSIQHQTEMNYQVTKKTRRNLKAVLLRKQNQSEKVLFDSRSITFWKTQTYRE